jgi:hypothetical protein
MNAFTHPTGWQPVTEPAWTERPDWDAIDWIRSLSARRGPGASAMAARIGPEPWDMRTAPALLMVTANNPRRQRLEEDNQIKRHSYDWLRHGRRALE